MSYDLGCRSGVDCGSGLPFGCGLDSQVEYYAGSYNHWLRTSNKTVIDENGEDLGDVSQVAPHQFNVEGARVQFGFEIGHVAYPGPAFGDDYKKMYLRSGVMNNMINSLHAKTDGVIVWEMFKATDGTYPDEVSTKNALGAACKAFALPNADCSANIPLAAGEHEEKSFLE